MHDTIASSAVRRATFLAAILAAAAVAGCAAPVEQSRTRRSAGTLIDESGTGEYDAWELLRATDEDPSVAIVGRGRGGATGEVRFVPAEDGSVTIIADVGGVTSELDFDANGAIVGEAHTRDGDGLLAELVQDLGERDDELAALDPGGADDDDGASREALTIFGIDLACALDHLGAHATGLSPNVCDIVVGRGATIELRVDTPNGLLANQYWYVRGFPGIGNIDMQYSMAAATVAPESTLVRAYFPVNAIDRGVNIVLRVYTNGVMQRPVTLARLEKWTGTRQMHLTCIGSPHPYCRPAE